MSAARCFPGAKPGNSPAAEPGRLGRTPFTYRDVIAAIADALLGEDAGQPMACKAAAPGGHPVYRGTCHDAARSRPDHSAQRRVTSPAVSLSLRAKAGAMP